MNTREITMMIALALLGACVIAPRHVTASQTLWGSIPPDAQFNIPPDEIDGFSTSIPGVGEVRLAALTVPKKTPAIWWLPYGGRISKPPADWPKGFPNMPLKPNMRAVGMVAKVWYVKGYDSKLNSLRWMVMDPSQSTTWNGGSGRLTCRHRPTAACCRLLSQHSTGTLLVFGGQAQSTLFAHEIGKPAALILVSTDC